MERVPMVLCVILSFQSIYTGGLILTGTTDGVEVGLPFTLVCSWNNAEYINSLSSGETDIEWIRGGVDEVYIFKSETCVLEKHGNNSSVAANYGYMYQSLIFANITSSDIGDVWYCKTGENISNHVKLTKKDPLQVRMVSQSEVTYTGSSITLTCSVDSETLAYATWSIANESYFRLGSKCDADFTASVAEERHIESNCSQNTSQTITINNASLSDHGVPWECNVGGKGNSNLYTVIVLDPPDLTNNVSLENVDSGNGSQILVCSSPCDNNYTFTWNFAGIKENLSAPEYDRCKHICSQSLTISVTDKDGGKTVQCTVSNPRTGKNKTAQYEITTGSKGIDGDGSDDDGLSKWLPHDSEVPAYMWGTIAGVGGIIIVIAIIVSVVVCRKRHTQTSSKVAETIVRTTPVMEDNILYESGGPEQDILETDRDSKVMEDNILYESGGPEQDIPETDRDSKVMEDNILYESGGPEQDILETDRDSKVMAENILYESGGPDPDVHETGEESKGNETSYGESKNKCQNDYFTIELTSAPEVP